MALNLSTGRRFTAATQHDAKNKSRFGHGKEPVKSVKKHGSIFFTVSYWEAGHIVQQRECYIFVFPLYCHLTVGTC